MNVIKFSQQTKQEANELLEYGGVVEVLAKYGQVLIDGSYKYDLMYGPDIDLVVLADDPSESSYQALVEFINQRKFQKYQLGDFKNFPLKDRPRDMIVVLVHEYKGRRWEIEVWFKESGWSDESDFGDLITKATDEQRRNILEIKKQREDSLVSKDKLDSLTIYKGVLLEEKTELKDFDLG